ncbi:acyltransferase [Peribacillus kribbensis]|uniref:acyltransferase n=1 Tax=Peribacillus kribbensis TaxID=356658 RepID=UPI0003F9C656|nr:acyltransferase [Peribacillus kribbensis]
MNVMKKIVSVLIADCRNRGIWITFLMSFSYLIAVCRGFIFKIIYLRNIRGSIFFLQSKSRIEVFNKRARLNIGSFVFIRKNASIRVDYNGQLNIEEKVFINDNCNINCINKISIGSNTKIAPNVCINDHDHNYKTNHDLHLLTGEVKIGQNVWIGSNVVILRDTVIGDNAVIAAGSIVKGEVPANSLFFNKRENSYIHSYYKEAATT